MDASKWVLKICNWTGYQTAITGKRIHLPDTDCVVTKAFLSKKTKCCAENMEIHRYRGWNFLPENQISLNLELYEINKVIEIKAFIAYIKWKSRLFSKRYLPNCMEGICKFYGNPRISYWYFQLIIDHRLFSFTKLNV